MSEPIEKILITSNRLASHTIYCESAIRSNMNKYQLLYVTGFEKRDLIAQIMILRYRRF